MSLNDFIIMKLLGKGSFGSVYLVKRKKDDQIYAMKRINLPKSPSNEKEAALNEIRLLASLSHPNVIGYKETFCDISTGDLCIVMEYGDGGDLAKRIEYNKSHHLLFEENMIWKWFIQLLNGLIFLRSHHIMHRDLKSANVFLMKNNIVKIGDLNVSKLSKNSLAKTKTGTPYYLAPEVWEDGPYDYKCDVWSLGCIIYELCCLVPPFRATNLKELYRTIRTGYYIPIPKEYSNELKIVISWMLNTNPLKRKSAKEILESEIVSNRIKSGSGKYILEMISKTKQNYNLIGTIKMPRNIKDINNVLPHERYKMEQNDPFETMKKTMHEKGLLNNYDRGLAEMIKKNNLNKNNNNNANNINVNVNNMNNVKENNNINSNDNQINIKPIIIKSEQRNKYENKYDIFNKNKNEINKVNLNNNNNNNINNGINNNINNIIINNINNNSNSKDNSDTKNKNIINSSNKNSIKNSINNKIIIDNNTNNSNSKKNSIKQPSSMNNNSKKMGADTRKRFEKQKFDEIKNEFKNKPLSKRSNNKFHQKQQNNNNKPRQRPPSGQPRYNPSVKMNFNNNINNKNNINNYINNNSKNINKQEQIRQRPLSHNNNRIMINNNMKNNIYINNNNNYYYINNHQNNKIKRYAIKNHYYNVEGQKFDMNPYKKQNKANYNKMDIYKYKEENKNKFNPYLMKGNENNYNYNYNVKYNIYNMHMKAQRERVNPSQKQKEIFFQREGKFRKY